MSSFNLFFILFLTLALGSGPVPQNDYNQVVILASVSREIASHPSQKIEAECTRREDVKSPPLLRLLILQTNNPCSFLLYQIAHKIPESPALSFCPVCDWHLTPFGGQSEANCVASGTYDCLADKVSLVKA